MKYGNHELHTFSEDVEPIRTVELPTKPEISMKKGFVKMKFAGPDGDELEGEGEGGELPGRILNRPKGRRIESFSHFHESKNVIPVTRRTSKQLDKSVRLTTNPDSNLTLFN